MAASPTPRWIAWTVAAAMVLIASLYAFHRLEQFLIRDARFTLGEAAPGSESLAITGSTISPLKPSPACDVFTLMR